MPTIQDICDRLKDVTDRLSTQVRALTFGTLAFTWGLLMKSDASAPVPQWARPQLFSIGVLSIVVLLLDVCQYIFGYIVAQRARSKIEALRRAAAEGVDRSRLEVDYDEEGWVFTLQMGCFVGKIALLGVPVSWLIALAFKGLK
jgi:hypothetical protein